MMMMTTTTQTMQTVDMAMPQALRTALDRSTSAFRLRLNSSSPMEQMGARCSIL
jgi:hypothetical protein